MTCMGLIAAIFSQLVFYQVLPNKKTTTAYLIGYGLIIPFWLWFPSTVIAFLDIRNKVFRFCVAAVTPSLCVFRTTEAMHGFAPEHALQSAKTYMVYYGLPMVAKYDKSTKEYVKASPGHLQYRFWQVIGSYIYTGSLYSIFFMYPKYFPSCGTIYSEHYFTLGYILSNKSLRNTTFYILLFEATLSTSGNGGNFVSTLLTGYEMEPFMNNPIFESNTCSEFWNKRWNKLIQTLLSRGIYKPLRLMLPAYAALTLTFVSSGLFHEWLMKIIFAPLPQDLDANGNCVSPKCFNLTHGSALAFFTWIAFIISMEFKFIPKYCFRTPVVTYKFLVSALTSLGGIFFLDPYIHTRFFNEGFVGYFMIHPVGRWV